MKFESILMEQKVNCPKIGRLLTPAAACFGDRRICPFYQGKDETGQYVQCSYNYEKNHPKEVNQDDKS